MTTYVVQDVQTISEAMPFARADFSDWSLIGTTKNGNDVESVYRYNLSDPLYPTEIRIGVYNKPGVGYAGRTSFSIKQSGWIKITADDGDVEMVPTSFTLAGNGPFGAVLKATNAAFAIHNVLSWVLPLEVTPSQSSWTEMDTTLYAAISNGVTALDLSNVSDHPTA
jgi:hypothetical protein